jgi:SAM-dependent methyltransferase
MSDTPSGSPLATPQAWNLVSADYAAEVMPSFARYAARAIELAEVPVGGAVIDVACGPGTLALQVAAQAKRVAAIDFSEEMIGKLTGHAGYGQLGNIEARVGDGQALPYGDDEFDAGFSLFGLIFFPDRAKGLAELRRVVKPGGKVVVSSWPPADGIPAMRAIFDAMRDATPGPPPPPFKMALGDAATIRDEFGAAGFRDVEVRVVAYDNQYASTAELWASMQRTLAPLVLMRERMGAAWPAAAEKIYASVEAALGTGHQVVVMPALLTVAVA